jgi:replicative DNA helicase
VSAPTSCGKSALANQILITAAVENGSRVAFYPLEMRQKQTLKRAIAVRSGNNPKYVRTLLNNAKHPEAQSYADSAAKSLMDACADLIKAPIHMRDDLYSLEAIIADIRAEHGVRPFDFICVDYLQLIRCQGRFERRQLQIAEIIVLDSGECVAILKTFWLRIFLKVCIPILQNTVKRIKLLKQWRYRRIREISNNYLA